MACDFLFIDIELVIYIGDAILARIVSVILDTIKRLFCTIRRFPNESFIGGATVKIVEL